MKAILAALLIAAPTLYAQETTYKDAPLSGDDIVGILELRAHKETVSFGKLKFVTLRVEAEGHKQDFVLQAPTSSVTLLTYIPTEGGPRKALQFWLTADNGDATHSYFSVDTSKTKFTKNVVFDGIYTVLASDSEDMKVPAYKIEVLTSDTKP